ncbi:helicase associated domain-containing protein [Pseudarthrobacter chlorophenolicus]|uniref:helicase associated domain-containing protein n=1 Tax=Pseudarthrobacter chlorophenolicus TaxID=85085 RepID=UPI0011134562|nr:helicase associated domain-containing protein [Pseudarthrobacter chlorophenolicus]
MNILTIPGAAAPASALSTDASAAADPWTAKAATVADFVARSGRLPVAGPDLVEDELAGWLAVQRRAAQQNRITDEHRRYLDSNIPGWRQTRQERWDSQLALLAEASANNTPVRGQLKVWLKSQRRAAVAGNLAVERKSALDARAPGWDRPAADAETLWLGRAEDLANYVDFAGRLPSSAGGTAESAGLYRWMNYQRSLAKAGKITTKRRKWLDKNVPGWLPAPDGREVQWSAHATALQTFLTSTGRWPRVAVSAERTLARWLGTQRAAARAGRLTAARREKLDTVAVGWLPAGRGPVA